MMMTMKNESRFPRVRRPVVASPPGGPINDNEYHLHKVDETAAIRHLDVQTFINPSNYR
jgi:hypothetical protein